MRDLLRPVEVARKLGVSRTWLYDAAKSGRIPSVRLGGADGPLRFIEEDVDRWLDEARCARRPGCAWRPEDTSAAPFRRPTTRAAGAAHVGLADTRPDHGSLHGR